MAILDFLWGGKAKRLLAKRLLASAGEPFDRLRTMIADAGAARHGADFERMWGGFVDCRIHRPGQLVNFPADDREALYRLVTELEPEARPLHAEVRQAFELIRREWRHGGLVEAAAGGGLRALDAFAADTPPGSIEDRIMRIADFIEIDVAAGDVRGELGHIAFSQSLFW